MTAKDVVSLFAGSLLVPGTQQVHREKASRAELLQALRDLAVLVPEWISLSSPDLSNCMTVWLVATADYASIRIKLGAPSNSSTKKPIEISNNAKTSTPIESSNTAAKRPIEATTTVAATTTTQEPARMVSESRSSKSTLESSPTKKQRTEIVASLKRPPSSDTLVSPKTKRKRGLRINKHLILTEADYDGGMILEPSLDESPRGLKRLFSQMNSGQRI
jgi:hypothetical protein